MLAARLYVYAVVIFSIGANCVLQEPNIVVILADDLGFNDVSFRGSDLIPTPNIDALAYSGIVLDRHYVLPTCTPSRAAFLTGRHAINFGLQGLPLKAGTAEELPLETKLMPEYLRELGYKTHMIGKWHLGFSTPENVPAKRGFDTFFGYYNGYVDYYRLDYNQTLTERQGKFFGYDFHDGSSVRWDLRGRYATHQFTEAAVNIIQNHDVRHPLFLYLSHSAPHTGNEEGDGLQPPPGVDPNKDFSYIKDPKRRRFASLVSSLDDSVGRVVEALSDFRLLDNTILVFMADNGANSVTTERQANFGSNWPLRGTKYTMYEGGVRGTALIWSKLLPQQKLHESVVHITDWLPTFVSVAGGNYSHVDGHNVWNDLKANTSSESRTKLINIDEVENSEGVLIGGRWKIVKQNVRSYANYDLHIDVQNHFSPINTTAPQVRNSVVGKIMQNNYGVSLEDSVIGKLRDTFVLHCDLTETIPMGKVNASTDFFCKDYCAFDVIADPCELTPLNRSDIINQGKYILDQWKKRLVRQKRPVVDERANPKNFGGAWSPWLYNDTALGSLQ